MVWQKIQAYETIPGAPEWSGLQDKYRQCLNFLLENCYYGPQDVTNDAYLNAKGYGAVVSTDSPNNYIVSKLINLPAPPSGYKWQIAIQFWGKRSFTAGSNFVRYNYNNYDTETAGANIDTAVTGSWVLYTPAVIYETTAIRKYFKLTAYSSAPADACTFKMPSVTVTLVTI